MLSKAKEGVTLFANGEEEQEEVRIEAMAKYSWGAASLFCMENEFRVLVWRFYTCETMENVK